jgi:hypothetical protein
MSCVYSMAEEDDDLMEQSIRNELPGTVKEIIQDQKAPNRLACRCARQIRGKD